MMFLFSRYGFVRLLGLGHIFWIPLVIWLGLRIPGIGFDTPFGIWLALVLACNKYNFGTMLENVPNQESLNEKQRLAFEDNRNLFYVACSRPKKRLALLFTQELSSGALDTLKGWFGGQNIESVY